MVAADWMSKYKWAIYSFIACAFWNLVGAGILGFLINPPLALYYMQGLNTTPLHGHTALFGVYGMLGIILHKPLNSKKNTPNVVSNIWGVFHFKYSDSFNILFY
ncbi:cbb3-type cytochrome c oxidase subunit I [Ancylomarina sp. YFZ004]